MNAKPLTIHVLPLHQPWASAVELGCKVNETRHWPTTFRGLFAVHAAKRWNRTVEAQYGTDPAFAGVRAVYPGRPPLGVVVALGLLTDCLHAGAFRRQPGFMDSTEAALGDYGSGRFAFKIESVRPLTTPLSLIGRQQPFFPWQIPAAQLHRALVPAAGDDTAVPPPLVSAGGEMLGCLRCGRTTLAERSGVRLTRCAFCPAEVPASTPSGRSLAAGYAYRRSDRRKWYVRFRHDGQVIRRGTGAETEAAAADALRSWKLYFARGRHVKGQLETSPLVTPPLNFGGLE